MMRIVFDHQIFSSQAVGGVSRYFVETCRRLNRIEGVSAEIVAPLHYNRYLAEEGSPKHLRIREFPKAYRFIQPIDQLISRRAIAKMRPDLVHETYYQFTSVAPHNCPTVITAYDVIHEKYHSDFRVRDNTTLRKRAAIRRAAHIIAISESTRRDYIEFFNVPEDKITTIHLGCSFAEPATNADEATAVASSERPFILYVGARKGYKNFARVLEAHFSSPILRNDYSLICFGAGDFSADESSLIAKYRGNSGGEVLHRSGADSVLNQLYRAATAFVYPSLYEGFGLPPIEAMAAGCPVACTDRSSVPEVVGDAAQLFDPESVDAIRAALEQIVLSPSLRNNMIQRGHHRAKLFTWDACVNKTLSVYRQILA